MSALAEVLAALAKMDPGQKAQVAAALAGEGYDGSQPMAGMEVEQGASDGSQPIAHAGAVEKTWVYDDVSGQQALDKLWIEVLNAAEGNAVTVRHKFAYQLKIELAHLLKCGTEIKFEVNLTEMTITNLKTKKDSVLHRKEMRVLAVKDMFADVYTADRMRVFQKDYVWKMQWQVEENCGWKNMTEDSNQALLTQIAAQNAHFELTDEWRHPETNKWNKSTYDVDLSLEQLTSREWPQTQRAVRLVAMREWNRHN